MFNKLIILVLLFFCVSQSVLLYKTYNIANQKHSISGIVNAASSKTNIEENSTNYNLEIVKVFHNIETMRNNYGLKPGMAIQTTGYYKNNDGGSALYTVREKKTNDFDDCGSIIFLKNGRVAELISSDKVNVKQFGAVGDGVADDTKAIKNAVFFSNCIVFPQGKYLINETLELEHKTLHGSSQSWGNETLILSKADIGLHLKNCNSINNITISKKEFPGGQEATKGIWIEGRYNRLNNVNIYNHAVGIYMMNDNNGCVYNHIVDGVILNCFEGIYIKAKARGWVNENTFQNINIRHYSSFHKYIDGLANSFDLKERFAVTMTYSNDAVHQINMNKFLCLNVEGCYNGFSVSAANCAFLSNRTEGNKIGYLFKDYTKIDDVDGVGKTFITRSNIIIDGVVRNIKQEGDVNREPKMYITVADTRILQLKGNGKQ